MRPITASKRPAEIVREYIEAEFLDSPTLAASSRLPTIHEFSRHLGVSVSTVRSVFKTLSQEGRLETIPGKGTFLLSSPKEETPTGHNCIGVNAIEGSVDTWWGTIFLGITSEVTQTNRMVTALGTGAAGDSAPVDWHQILNRVDGMIAFPQAGNAHEIDKACAELNLPVVHVNPTVFHATANFVSNDYFGFAYRLALAWRETGRRKIVLVVGSPVTDSVSAAQAFSAFSLAYASCADARVQVIEGTPSEEQHFGTSFETGRVLMDDFLKANGPESVDAVYGFGDLLAEGAAHSLLNAGRSLPDDVSVVGGTGLKAVESGALHLVAMKQPMHKIGRMAARMVIWRIENHSHNVPGVYLMPELGEGSTIRTEERKAFRRLRTEDTELVERPSGSASEIWLERSTQAGHASPRRQPTSRPQASTAARMASSSAGVKGVG